MTPRPGYRTFAGEVVKSHDERLIADFLYLNGRADRPATDSDPSLDAMAHHRTTPTSEVNHQPSTSADTFHNWRASQLQASRDTHTAGRGSRRSPQLASDRPLGAAWLARSRLALRINS